MRITNKMIYDKLISVKKEIRNIKLTQSGIKQECANCEHWERKESTDTDDSDTKWMNENFGLCKIYTPKEDSFTCGGWYVCKDFTFRKNL